MLCFISTKHISFVTEYIVSMAVHCSDVDLIQCQKFYILCFISTFRILGLMSLFFQLIYHRLVLN